MKNLESFFTKEYTLNKDQIQSIKGMGTVTNCYWDTAARNESECGDEYYEKCADDDCGDKTTIVTGTRGTQCM